MDDTTIEMIREEVYNVVTHDPRFELSVDNSVTVSKKDQTVTVAVELLYLPSTTATDLQIIFDTDFTEMAEF